jgi:hypothetical protein
MPVVMFDTTTLNAIPVDASAVAGYVGGMWPTYFRLVEMFPNAHHLSIAVDSDEDAECLDIEVGDARPPDAPAWVRRQLERGVARPVVYASVSLMAETVACLRATGVERSSVRLWTAHYTHVPHVCSTECGLEGVTSVDATQWTDRALGLNLDESLCSDTFLGPPPPPPDPNHYDWYATGPFEFPGTAGHVLRLNERAIVQEYDNLRVHARMNQVRLAELRELITFLRKRVWYVAHHDLRTGTKLPRPDWDEFHRGWRWRMLLRRSQGEAVTK